jgi:hypothetical protein
MTALRCLPLLLAIACLCAAEDDPVAKELDRYDEAVAKLQKSFDEGIARERTKSIPALAAVAKKQVTKGDMPGAIKAWKAVLKLDREHADARQFFTSLNQLDQVLAEIDGDPGGSELLGEGKAMGKPVDAVVKIDATGSAPLGAIKNGTTLTFTYKSGQWTFRRGVRPFLSPDAPEADNNYRMLLIGPTGQTLAVIPVGTATTPFTWTASADLAGASLRINRIGLAPEGVVTYAIRAVAPR